MIDEVERIARLSKGESQWQMKLSITEELGEICAAIKQEDGLVNHKSLSEPSYSECVDAWICAVGLYTMLGGKTKTIIHAIDYRRRYSRLDDVMRDIWSSFGWMCSVTKMDYNHVVTIVGLLYELYRIRGGDYDKFMGICNAKLDKWERNFNNLQAATASKI